MSDISGPNNEEVPFRIELQGTVSTERVPELVETLRSLGLDVTAGIQVGSLEPILDSPFLERVETKTGLVTVVSKAGAVRYEQASMLNNGNAERTFNNISRSRVLEQRDIRLGKWPLIMCEVHAFRSLFDDLRDGAVRVNGLADGSMRFLERYLEKTGVLQLPRLVDETAKTS
ncbi:MAG TPA: hypothetical protein VJJ78_03660 [Candidatus Saccharimonadales bacterium]|nr:hypothetical protein [Candidatus Saccharimonadales bacterium]